MGPRVEIKGITAYDNSANLNIFRYLWEGLLEGFRESFREATIMKTYENIGVWAAPGGSRNQGKMWATQLSSEVPSNYS